MATVKIHNFSHRLDKKLRYVMNPEKTDDGRLVSTLNIYRDEKYIYEAMMETKHRYKREGGVLGYHIIQSFKPHEVSPEEAHKVGLEFARRVFGDQYEVVITTHIDKEHFHNHLVINSVSRETGKKYHDGGKKNLEYLRGVSDEICREFGLSVIENPKKGKHKSYNVKEVEKSERTNMRKLIREDIDSLIPRSQSLPHLLSLLRNMNYEVRTDGKYMRVKPLGADIFFRLYKLGDEYNEEHLVRRIRNKAAENAAPVYEKPDVIVSVRYKRYMYRYPKRNSIMRTYIKYRTILKKLQRKTYPYYPPAYMRADLMKLQSFSDKSVLLHRHRIRNIDELENAIAHKAAEVKSESDKRGMLRAALHEETDPRLTDKYIAEIDKLTQTIKLRSRERRLLLEVRKENEVMRAKTEIEYDKVRKSKGKEMEK